MLFLICNTLKQALSKTEYAVYIELFMSQIRNEYCIETKAKFGFSSVRKGSFPPLEFPHRLKNGLFYFNQAFGKMLTSHKCGL